MEQDALSQKNQIAWNDAAYDAWVKHYGDPKTAAAELCQNPEHTARRILPHLAKVKGAQIANPLGSHGRLAVALSLLGADVTVFDISQSNAKYGQELAAAAQQNIQFLVGDFLATASEIPDRFGYAVMDLGILHYFISIADFAVAIRTILKPGGTMVLSDFHPITKKAIEPQTNGISLRGSYFDKGVEEAPTPYEAFLDQKIVPCLVRRWRIDETLNAFIGAGFTITRFEEHPDGQVRSLPGTFTLVARSPV